MMPRKEAMVPVLLVSPLVSDSHAPVTVPQGALAVGGEVAVVVARRRRRRRSGSGPELRMLCCAVISFVRNACCLVTGLSFDPICVCVVASGFAAS